MAVTIDFYNAYFVSQLDGSVDLDTDTLKIALTTSAYTYSKLHDFFDDITNEVVGTGYTAGGVTLASVVLTQDDTNDRATFDFANPEWASSTITARHGVLYKDTGAAATSPLICDVNFGANFSSSASTFRVELDSVGLFVLQAA